MDITDAQLSGLQHLRQAQALHTGKSKVQLFSDALGKQVQMIVSGYGGNDHVQPVDLFRIQLGHCLGQESRLLLVAALQSHLISAMDHTLQKRNDAFRGNFLAAYQLGGICHALMLGAALAVPNHEKLLAFAICLSIQIISLTFCSVQYIIHL